MKYEIVDINDDEPIIKVLGVGGGGGNAINYMANSYLEGVEFISANTDIQALRKTNVDRQIQLGCDITKGLGAGTKPEIGKQAALESAEKIKEAIADANMIFLTAGMGGGTGTGAIPIIAEIARELGILTVAVVTKPFDFEGKKKQIAANEGIAELEQYADSLIVVHNQKLIPVLGASLTVDNAFKAANDVLLDAIQGITELITRPGLINLDFADVTTTMLSMGSAIMGSGSASGDNRARVAVEQAISCPLLEDVDLHGAKGILVNITAADMEMAEFEEIGNIMNSFATADTVIKIGTAVNADMNNEIKVTVVATGMGTGNSVDYATPVPLVQKPMGQKDYETLDKPTVIRNSSAKNKNRFGVQPKQDTNLDYLDVPAFLRRQAD